MSVLFDSVIAELADAPAIVQAEDLSRWSAQSLGIGDKIALAELWAVLENRAYMEDDALRFKTVARHPGGSSWLLLVPPPLVSALAALTDSQATAIAARWRDVALVREPRLYAPAFEDNLAKLRSQARRARDADRPLMILVTV